MNSKFERNSEMLYEYRKISSIIRNTIESSLIEYPNINTLFPYLCSDFSDDINFAQYEQFDIELIYNKQATIFFNHFEIGEFQGDDFWKLKTKKIYSLFKKGKAAIKINFLEEKKEWASQLCQFLCEDLSTFITISSIRIPVKFNVDIPASQFFRVFLSPDSPIIIDSNKKKIILDKNQMLISPPETDIKITTNNPKSLLLVILIKQTDRNRLPELFSTYPTLNSKTTNDDCSSYLPHFLSKKTLQLNKKDTKYIIDNVIYLINKAKKQSL